MNFSEILLKKKLNQNDVAKLSSLSEIEIKLLFMSNSSNKMINDIIIDFIFDIKFLENYYKKNFYINAYNDLNHKLAENRVSQLNFLSENKLQEVSYIKKNHAINKLNTLILDMIDLKRVRYFESESLFCFELDLGARFSTENRYDYIVYNNNSSKFYIVSDLYSSEVFNMKESSSSSISLFFEFMESKISKDKIYKINTYRKRKGKIFKNFNELELMKEISHDKQKEEFLNNLK